MQALELPSDALKPLRISRRRTTAAPSNVMNTWSNLTPGAEGQPHTRETGDGPLSSSSNINSRRPALPTLDLSSLGDVKAGATKVQSSSRVIRPLPMIPSSASLSSATTSASQSRAIRPLPSPPSTAPSSAQTSPLPSPPSSAPSSTNSSPHFTLLPAPPIIPTIASPPAVPKSPPKPKLPTLLTNSDFLKAPAPASDLNSPESPQPPTPQTAKRKRMAKLRRHLGESILDESAYARPVDATGDTMAKTLEDIPMLGEHHVDLRAAITVGKIFDMFDEEENDMEDRNRWSSSDELSAEEPDEQRQDYPWVLHNGTPYRAFASRRYSRKWMRDKGGRRWEESDYKNILKALRTL